MGNTATKSTNIIDKNKYREIIDKEKARAGKLFFYILSIVMFAE
jgi:hypothetical protein